MCAAWERQRTKRGPCIAALCHWTGLRQARLDTGKCIVSKIIIISESIQLHNLCVRYEFSPVTEPNSFVGVAYRRWCWRSPLGLLRSAAASVNLKPPKFRFDQRPPSSESRADRAAPSNRNWWFWWIWGYRKGARVLGSPSTLNSDIEWCCEPVPQRFRHRYWRFVLWAKVKSL